MSSFPGQPGHRELRVLLGRGLIARGLAFVGVGMLFVAGAVLVAYVFDDLLPDGARFWGTLSLCAFGLGWFLLGAASMLQARRRGEGAA